MSKGKRGSYNRSGVVIDPDLSNRLLLSFVRQHGYGEVTVYSLQTSLGRIYEPKARIPSRATLRKIVEGGKIDEDVVASVFTLTGVDLQKAAAGGEYQLVDMDEQADGEASKTLTNTSDEWLRANVHKLVDAIAGQSLEYAKSQGIPESCLRIMEPWRLMVLIDGGSRWSVALGLLDVKEGSSLHLAFSTKDVEPDLDEMWFAFFDERLTYHTVIAQAMSKSAVRHPRWHPFQDVLAISIPADALNHHSGDLLRQPVEDYVNYECKRAKTNRMLNQ